VKLRIVLALTAAGLLTSTCPAAAETTDRLVVRRYEASLETKTSFVGKSTGGAGSQTQASIENRLLQLEVQGAVEVVVLEDEVDGVLARVSLTGTRFSGVIDGKRIKDADLAPTQQQLSEGIYVKTAANGAIRDVRDSHLTDRFAVQMLKFLAYGMQLQKPENDTAATWSAEESDGTGRYEATYELTKRGDGGRFIVKRKAGYKSIAFAQVSGQPGAAPEGSVQGTITVQMDGRDGWIGSLEGEETSAIFLFDRKIPQSTSKSRLKLKRAPDQKLSASEHDRARRTASAASTSSAVSEQRTKNAAISTAKATLGNATPVDLQRMGYEADVAKKNGATNDVDVDVFMKVRAFFILHPDRVGEIERLYADQSQANSFYRASLLALSALPDPVYVAALHRAIKAAVKAHAWESALYAIPLLGRHPAPPQESEDLLAEIASSKAPKEVQDSAHLALGAISAKLRETNPSRARRIVDRYAKMVPDEDDQLLAIEVLGNTGSEDLLGVLDGPMQDSSELVRSTAVYSLRRVASSKATDKVVSVAASDKSASVRKAACDALVLHADLTRHISTLAQLLRKDDSVDVRHGLIRLLARYYLDSAEARAALDEAALRDKDASVRQYAKTITGGTETAPRLLP
jgi:HEAT repeat protein